MENIQIFKNMLDVTPFACVLMADTFEIQYMNPVMSEFFSLNSAQEMTGSAFLRYIPEEEQHKFIEFINRLGESQPTQAWQLFKIIDVRGVSKYILFNGIHNLQHLGAEGIYFLAGMPIIEHHLERILTEDMEDKIRNRFSNSKYDSLIESATIGITILTNQGEIEDANRTFSDQIGQNKEGIVGKHYQEVFNKETTDTLDALIKTLEAKDCDLVKDVLTITHPNRSHSILEISIAKIKDVGAHSGKFMVITEDITEQEDTHQALLQSEKLALTGRLAASLAHEINNPLQTSLGCLGLVEEMLDDEDDDLRVYIEMAMEELQRSARIVKKLRDLNRKTDPSDKTPINLQEILEGVLVLTKNRLYDQNIVPIFPYQGPQPYVLGSRDQIQQVILNLVMNALDAMQEGGNIYLDLFETKNPKGYDLRVRDTGKGISQEVMENLFDPFFTTKEDGLGLGLYISKQIINEHDGEMRVESEPGKGTAFSIWLPGLDDFEPEE
jgi:PAS domain S-box-containing protein